ncbi:MAG: ATP-binding protein [Bacteroidota bacterium]
MQKKISDLKKDSENDRFETKLQGQSEARSQLARDWHDGIGNSLATLRLLVDSLQTNNQQRHTETLTLLEEIHREFKQLLAVETASNFETVAMVKTTLQKWQTRLQLGKMTFSYQIDLTVRYDGWLLDKKNQLYRIVQELITNTLKHAAASEIKFEIKENKNQLDITYSDNGIGIAEEPKEELNFASIQYRLNQLNGQFTTMPSTDGGIAVQIVLPL